MSTIKDQFFYQLSNESSVVLAEKVTDGVGKACDTTLTSSLLVTSRSLLILLVQLLVNSLLLIEHALIDQSNIDG